MTAAALGLAQAAIARRPTLAAAEEAPGNSGGRYADDSEHGEASEQASHGRSPFEQISARSAPGSGLGLGLDARRKFASVE